MKEHHKGHKKMGVHPHDKMAALPQFNEGHWQKDLNDLATSETKYTSGEFDNPENLKRAADGLAHYARTHKAKN